MTTNPPTSVEAFAAAPVAAGRYRCPDHPDQAVTWKGGGCPECAAEARDTRGRRSRPAPTADTKPIGQGGALPPNDHGP